jgi:trk system potassium uptake protein TrkH
MQDQINPNDPFITKPGDKFFRIPRIKTLHITIDEIHIKRPRGISLWSLVYGFAGMILVGTLLLTLPISSNSGQWTSFMTSLFTATSSVCVTGLAVVDTFDHWNFFGQLVILLLIQLGGLGFVTSTIILMLAAGRKIGLRERILISKSSGMDRTGGIVRLTRNTIYFTLIAEILGALVFLIHFYQEDGWAKGVWTSIFQSISAFNNAGFDLFGGFHSLSGYYSDYLIVLTTAMLIILGGISFIVIQNIYHSRGLKRSSADTKLVILITGILLSLGTVLILAIEFNNPQTLGPMSLPEKILNAFFLSVTSRTAGFSTISVGSAALFSILTVMVLMFIGGASNSTAGGIKVNTIGLIAATIWHTIRGKANPGAFGREFQIQQLLQAITLLVLSFGLIVVAFLILSITENFPSIKILFETISAFGLVGLSTGITPDLSIIGKLVIILLMFTGRLGPLTLIIVLTKTQRASVYRYPTESIRIG